jgi:hypothetical protein
MQTDRLTAGGPLQIVLEELGGSLRMVELVLYRTTVEHCFSRSTFTALHGVAQLKVASGRVKLVQGG